MSWYLEVLRKYARFDGRARRMEYWYFALFNILVEMGLALLALGFGMLFGHSDVNVMVSFMMVPICLYSLAVLIPSLAVTVRRLHDTGRSGWWYFIAFVPFFGGIILFVFTLLEGDPGPNMYGSSPKGDASYGQVYPASTGY
jgi:uncharacterized membrane protein YhaH (DUF805 family)